jgi:hypothetical protein
LLSCKFPKLVKRFTRIRCKMSYVLAFWSLKGWLALMLSECSYLI